MGATEGCLRGSLEGGGLKDDTIINRLITAALTLSLTANALMLLPLMGAEPFEPSKPTQLQRQEVDRPIWLDYA